MRLTRTARLNVGSTAGANALASLVAATVVATLSLSPADAKTLRVGNEGVYPPFSIIDSDGKPTGIEPDLAREVCKRMKVECEIVAMDFKALIPSILQGKFDFIATQYAPTPQRKAKLDFSIPVVLNPGTYVVPKDSNFTFTAEGMKGKGVKIGLQRGSAMVEPAKKAFGDSVEYVYYDNPDQMKLDLLAGRINMVFDSKINWTTTLIEKPEGKDWKLDGGDFWVGDPNIPEAERGYSWVVRKGNTELLDKINAALKEIVADCTYTQIRKKYLSVPSLPAERHCVS